MCIIHPNFCSNSVMSSSHYNYPCGCGMQWSSQQIYPCVRLPHIIQHKEKTLLFNG
uniref:Uncharacterized protein n=1 Tax=Arundo donax TaxID=35708 RepID=A0A0A9B191_ARUDO